MNFVTFESHIFAQNLSSVPFETIDQGQYSDITTAMNLVIYKKRPWIAFWKEHAGNTEAPLINFRKETEKSHIIRFRGDTTILNCE
ncbi:MAG: hypothetical protein ACK41Q_00310 [Candidatus Brocadia sp.]